MYKSIYDSWKQEDKRRILEDNENLRSRVNELDSNLRKSESELVELKKQKRTYEEVKLSNDTNLALDAFVHYKENCETQLRELNERFSKSNTNIIGKCRRVTLASNIALIVLLGSIIIGLSYQKNGYIDDINKLNSDNQKLQSDYNEVSNTVSNYKNTVSNYKNTIDTLKTQHSECESALESKLSKSNSKRKKN